VNIFVVFHRVIKIFFFLTGVCFPPGFKFCQILSFLFNRVSTGADLTGVLIQGVLITNYVLTGQIWLKINEIFTLLGQYIATKSD